MIEEIKNIKARKKDLRSFGITIGLILLAISAFLLYKHIELNEILFYISVTFISLGIFLPVLLKPTYIIWMIFSIILGWIMTRIILSLLFYIIITPTGLLMRIFGKDFLSLKDKNQKSYWNLRDKKTEREQNYEKQF